MMNDGERAGTSQGVSGQRRPARAPAGASAEANDDLHHGAADPPPRRNVRPRTDDGPPRGGRYPPNVVTPDQIEGLPHHQQGHAHAPHGDQNARTFLLDIHSFCRVGRPCQTLLDLAHEDDKFDFIGEKLFYLREDDSDEQKLRCRTFLKAYFDHLVNNRIMLVEGRAGSGKTTLVEQIAMMYISEANNSNSGYLIVTNGCNTLTEQRLFRYMHNGQEYLGPVSTIIRDACAHPDSRYVFILHEWNRVSDFMSLLGNFFEEELRAYGPDSWQEMADNRDDWGPHILQGNVGQATTPDDLYFIPSNFRIILTGNPCRDDFMSETADFMVDPALRGNRLVGARVVLDESIFSLELPNRYPYDYIEPNLRSSLSLRYTGASIDELIWDIMRRWRIQWYDNDLPRQTERRRPIRIMPGKLVSEVKRRNRELVPITDSENALFPLVSDYRVLLSVHDEHTDKEWEALRQQGRFVARNSYVDPERDGTLKSGKDLIFDYFKSPNSTTLRTIYLVAGQPENGPVNVYSNPSFNTRRAIYPVIPVVNNISQIDDDRTRNLASSSGGVSKFIKGSGTQPIITFDDVSNDEGKVKLNKIIRHFYDQISSAARL
ncbi:hypothetical protein M9434_002745 [Picochlorum sp. BPE23]|nr:hypothetical protein M9434_002745 [Picochlorum sp. BPE23]